MSKRKVFFPSFTSMSMEVLASRKKSSLKDRIWDVLYNLQNVEKSGCGQPVCVCLLSVLL